jgi:hypothetical protein
MSAMTAESESRRGEGAEFDDELSDESLDRPPAGCALICMGLCGSE